MRQWGDSDVVTVVTMSVRSEGDSGDIVIDEPSPKLQKLKSNVVKPAAAYGELI